MSRKLWKGIAIGMPISLALWGALVFSAASAFGQVVQSGSVTPGTAAYWVSNGVIGGGVTASDSPLTGFGVTSNTTAGLCVSSGRSTAAGRQQLCLGAPLNGDAVISLQNYGTASAQALKFVINGVSYTFPGSLSGITIGTTPITGGSTGNCLYDAGGVVGEVSCGAAAITQLTGDVTAVGPGAVPATLATVNANIGTWGSTTQTPQITVDAKGRITAVSNVTISADAGSLSGTTLAANVVNSSLTKVGALSSGSLASGFTIVSPTLGGTGINNGSSTLTLGGNLTTSGAFASTFTMTGVTNVTFPTSGTLATTTGANVASVSNSDGTLTISPTSGAVIASLNLAHANTWSAQQTFGNNLAAITGSSTGYTALGSANASASNFIATFPANTGTVAELNLAQSWTATQTLQTLLAGTTNTYDIGTSASVAAFRTIYAGTSFVGPLVNATTGFQVNGAATSGNYLRGNGTNFVSSTIQAGDLPLVGDASGSPSATFGVLKADGTTITCTSGTCSAVGGVATSIGIGTTTITSGASGTILYDNSGVVGELNIASAAQLAAGTANKIVDAAVAVSAPALSVLTPGATVTPDLNVAYNFSLAPNQNFTLANPSNITGKTGRSFCIVVTNDSTPRTITALGSSYFGPGGSSTITLTASAGAIDQICGLVVTTSQINLTITRNYSH